MPPIEQLAPGDLSRALECLFAGPTERDATACARASSFHAYLAECRIPWTGFRAGPPEAIRGLFFAMLMPGRTALALLPAPGCGAICADIQLAVTRAGLSKLASHHLHYAQTLLDDGCDPTRRVIEQAGFQVLAPLIYLERDSTFPWVDPPDEERVDWIAYSDRAHADFAHVVLASYQDSLDCPELMGLRPIDDVLAAHRGSGRHDPALWQVARVDGQAAGCLLLAEMVHAPMVEIVYMGVVPRWRRRGVGQTMLRRALQLCRARRAQQLSVVVDGRNTPARKLYAHFAFEPVAHRMAYLYRWLHA